MEAPTGLGALAALRVLEIWQLRGRGLEQAKLAAAEEGAGGTT
jgi:hypothetical protein